jgi:hypothetical protein
VERSQMTVRQEGVPELRLEEVLCTHVPHRLQV